MWLLYQLAMAFALVIAAPFLLIRRGAHYLETLPGRLTLRLPTAPSGSLWLHAVSVGEVGVAATVARALPESVPLLVTTVTPTGQARARATLGERATVAYLPFDLGFAVRRFMRHFRPTGLVLVEGDYWPLVLRATRRARIPVTVVNGRVSGSSFGRMRKVRPLSGLFFDPVDRFGMQTAADRDRLTALGVDPDRIEITGNLKFDADEPPPLDALGEHMRALAAGREILVAGSTMAGEDEQVLDAFTELEPNTALLILAPRHPERCPDVLRLLGDRGIRHVARSRLETPTESDRVSESAPESTQNESSRNKSSHVDVVLLDTLGELASLYRFATAAFVGGTLVATGGHNPLEPARFAVPTVVGPSMENFRDIANSFDHAEAWHRVENSDALAAIWRSWLADHEAARAVGARGAELVAASRGALARTVDLLSPVVESIGSVEVTGPVKIIERGDRESV